MARFDWLRNLRASLSRPQPKTTRTRRPRLVAEALEDRTTPALTIVSASPGPEWVATPLTQLDLNFNAPLDPTSVQAGDLTLLRNGSTFGTITAGQVVPGTNNQTVRFYLTGLTTAGQLTTYMRPGAVLSSTGEANDAYTANYTLTSIGFAPVEPAGSLIYSGSQTGGTHTFAVEAGQTITLVATPLAAGSTPVTVTLRGPAGATGAGPVIGSATAPSLAVAAILQTVAAPSTGLYTASITGGSAGAPPTLKVILNARQELEGTGSTNNTPATAESLASSFTAISATADRGGVVGTFTGSPDHYAVPLQAGQSVSIGLSQTNKNTRLFNNASLVSTTSAANDVAIGDLNGDGLPDLVHALGGTGASSILVQYRTGNGGYVAGIASSTGGGNARAVRLADFNGDGKLDAAVANEASNTVSIHLGTGANPVGGDAGSPSFGAAVAYPGGALPRDLAVGDLDGDGDLDLAIGRGQGNTIGVLLNNGAGTFASVVNYISGGFNSNGIAIGDVTGDGKADIVATSVDNPGLAVLPGVGNGTFGPAVFDSTGTSNPTDLVLGDLNGDGRLDAAVAHGSGQIRVLLNQNNAADPFAANILVTTGTAIQRLAAADFNADGKLDLAATFTTTTNPNVRVYLGKGDGTFPTQIDYSLSGSPAPSGAISALGIAAADANGDGTPDLVTSNIGSNNLSIVTNALSALRVDLVDAAGSVLAAGTSTGNTTSSIASFVAPSTGSYFVRMSGTGRTDYAAVITRGATFDREPNSTAATAQSLDETNGSLGHLSAPQRYFTLVAGAPATIQERTAAGTVIRSYPVPGNLTVSTTDPAALAFDGKSLWLSLWFQNHNLYELDPDTGFVRDADVIAIPFNGVDGLAVLNGRVYFTDGAGNSLQSFDPTTDTFGPVLSIGNANPGTGDLFGGLAGITGPNRLVATTINANGTMKVVEFDPLTGVIATSFTTGTPDNSYSGIPNGAARGVAVIDGEIHIARIDGGLRTDVYSRDGVFQRFIVAANVISLGGDDIGGSTADWYTVSVPAGFELQLATQTPSTLPGAYANTLDPRLEVFDSAGMLIASGTPTADGRNEIITVAETSAAAVYRVRISSTGATAGEYFLASTLFQVNHPPEAANDAATTDEDTPVVVAVLANDTDPDGDTVSVVSVGTPTNGTATLNGDGTITYTPNANFFGTDSFSYMAGDGRGGTDTATVSITVTPVPDDFIIANPDAYSTPEDTVLEVQPPGLRANDRDPDGEPFTITFVGSPDVGTLESLDPTNDPLLMSGGFRYIPPANFVGTATFRYGITGEGGVYAETTVTITITAVNDAPFANDDTVTLDEDTSATFGVTGNDFDIENNLLSVSAITQPAHGTAVLNPDGTITYTPVANYNGPDSLTYTVSDGNGGSNTATVTFTVSPVHDTPIAFDDAYTTDEDTTLTVPAPGVMANDADPDGDAAVYIVQQPAAGTVTLAANGGFVYAPPANFVGTVTFNYVIFNVTPNGTTTASGATATITVRPVNDAPSAVNDTATTAEDTPTAIDVRANDTDVDNNALTVTAITQPTNGTATLNPNGTVTYTPNANYFGSDSFTYTIADGNGGTATATVSLTVTAVNDAPTATADAYSTDEDTALTIPSPGVRANDTDIDGDSLTARLLTQPSHGTVTLNADGSFTYTPTANYNGPDAFTYEAFDGSLASTATTVSLTVRPINDAPTAAAGTTTTAEDTAIDFDLRTLVADGETPTAALVFTVGGVTNGTVQLLADGYTARFTPNANFNGSASFDYTVTDTGDGASAALTRGNSVAVTVTAVNDAPTANADVAATDEDTAVVVAVLANDFDIDGDLLTLHGVSVAGNGTAVANANGTITYTPNANFFGNDSFTYTVRDTAGATATATVNVNVRPVNDNPVARTDTTTTAEDTAVNVNVVANDTDVDGDTLAVNSFTQGKNGAVAINGDGTLKYTPAANFFGSDSFTYTVADGKGGTASATVNVTITAVNDAPTVTGGPFAVPENSPTGTTVGTVVGADVDGNPLTYSITGGNTGGAFAINATTGLVTVATPSVLDFETTPTFTLTVRAADGQGGTANAAVVVNLTNVAPQLLIDVIPGSSANAINLKKLSQFEVAIVSSTEFNAQAVDLSSIRFGRTGTEDSVRRNNKGVVQSSLRDVNGDGRLDLVVIVDTAKTGLQVGNTQAVMTCRLTGFTTVYSDADAVTVTSSNK